MLRLATGLSFSRPEMEQWFQRAMKLDTNNYAACSSKLHFLKPMWHGTPGKDYRLLKIVTQPATPDQFARLGNDRAPVVLTKAG